ncbi:MAG: hypothetical protein HZC36_08670 [Armatimonadetes bacterium]|nr:hypothetical protein [Armatimonadota bacterium]
MIVGVAAMALACLGQASAPASQRLLDFAIRSWAATPKMEIEDAYKWLFHATQGGEHAVLDEEGPRQWLDSEWRGLAAPSPGEPEAVALDPNGGLLRVNLRPYRTGGGDREMLLAVFVESARRFRADRRSFRSVWDLLGVTLKRRSLLRLSHWDWKQLDLRCVRLGYPAIGHSAAYIRTYRPAYRVVLGSMWVTRAAFRP